MNNIAIVNFSSVVNNEQVKGAIVDLQIQINRDFTPIWGIGANLSFYENIKDVPANYWQMAILDNSDQQGVLGFHDVSKSGMPLGKVFAKTDLDNNLSWTVTLSHEILEMLSDPWINLVSTALLRNGNMRLYAFENCDAVEADNLGYKINNTLVSNFVYPTWFQDTHHPKGTKFDHQGVLVHAFQLAKGGYISIMDVPGNGWKQIYGEIEFRSYNDRAKLGSRRERRMTDRAYWLNSKI